MHRFIVFILGYCCALGAHANARQPEFEASASYVSEYNDRGASVAGEQVWTSFSVTSGNFSASLSYARSLGDGRKIYADELDFNIDYSFKISDMVSANIGADIINDPASGGFFDIGKNAASTAEVYSGLSFDTTFQPNITAIYDIYLHDFTLEGAVEHNIALSETTTFIPSATAGYAAISQGVDNTYLTGTMTLENQFSDIFTAFANASFGISSRKTFSDFKFQDNAPLPIITNHSSSVWAQVGFSAQF